MAIHGASSASQMTDAGAPASERQGAGGWQEATIEAIASLTPRVKSFMLRPPLWRPFVAGQHLDIRLTAPDGYQAQRSYSVASAPDAEGTYELAIEALEGGEVSPFFHEVAQVGDRIEIRGPFGGYFNWTVANRGPILLIGGGSGVVPLISMVRHRAARQSDVAMGRLFGARGMADAAFADELQAFDAAADDFRLAFALSREEATRPQDFSGRIDAAVIGNVLGTIGRAPRTVYVCGANRFVEAVTTHLVAVGQPPATIRTERFGGA
jgi:ferredoxin-NADP reductase